MVISLDRFARDESLIPEKLHSDSVDDIVRTYAAKNDARRVLKEMGVEAIPRLAEILKQRNRDNREHHAVAGVLLDLGGNDCLFVLIDALNGNTQIPRHQAASYIQAFHSKYRWDTARLREVNGLVDAALDYLADDGGISGVNLVHRLRLTEAVPILRQIQARADPSLQTRIQAAIADIEAVAAIDED